MTTESPTGSNEGAPPPDLAGLSADGLVEQCLLGDGQEGGHTARVLGDYELFEELGRGGMGVVYRARQISLDRAVALKLLLGGEFARKDFVQRFRQEAQLAARLRHRHVMTVYETGEEEGMAYIAMELVEGPSLQDGWREPAAGWQEKAAFMAKVARAVDFAHVEGVIHRDLKPSNILRDAFGEPRVADFGLARLLQGDSTLTATMDVLGSPPYMAPEQAAGPDGHAGVAADIYSLGGVLYFLLTGRPPFQAASVAQILALAKDETPLGPRRLNPSLPRDLETVALRCLEKDPARRYASAAELADELERFAAGEPVRARPVGAMGRLWRWVKRKPSLAAVSGLAVAALVAIAVISTMASQRLKVAARLADAEADRARQAAMLAAENADHARESARLAEESNQTLTALLDQNDLQKAEDQFAANHTTRAMATLLTSLRRHPQQPVASARLMAALGENRWAMPDGAPAFIPDCQRFLHPMDEGRRVLVIGRDYGQTSVRDMQTLKMLYPIQGAPTKAKAWAADDEGTRLAIASDADEMLRVWDLKTGERVGADIPCGPGRWSLAFRPGGKHLAVSTYNDRRAVVWRLDEPQSEPWDLSPKDGASTSMAWSPDGRWLAECDDRMGTRLWDMAAHPKLVGRVAPQGARVQFTPAGHLLAIDWDNNIRLLSVPDGKLLGQVKAHDQPVHGVTFSADGSRMVTFCHEGTARVWRLAGLEPDGPPLKHDTWVQDAQFSPDGSRLATCGDHFTRVWDTRTWQPLSQPLLLPPFLEPATPYAVAWRPDSQSFITAGGAPSLCRWRLHAPVSQPREILHDAGILCMVISPDHSLICLGDFKGRILALRSSTFEVLWTTPVAAHPPTQMAFDATGEKIAWGCDPENSFGVVHTSDGRPDGAVKHLQYPFRTLAWHPTEPILAAGSTEGEIQAWRWPERMQWHIPSNGNNAYSLQWAPDGSVLAVGSESGVCSLRAAEDGHEVRAFAYSLPGEPAHGMQCGFSSDGGKLMLIGDHDLRLFDWPHRPAARTFASHHFLSPSGDMISRGHTVERLEDKKKMLLPMPAVVLQRAWSPSGGRIALGCANGFFRVMDTRTGIPITGPLKNPAQLGELDFLDESTVVCTTRDGHILRWQLLEPVPVPLAPEWLDLAAHFAGQGGSHPFPKDALERIKRLYPMQ